MKEKFKNFFANSRLRHGTIASVITIVVIISVILLNVGMKALSDKVKLSFDLTKNKAFTITDISKDYLSSLEKDVDITVTAKEDDFISYGDYFIQANEVLKQYARETDKIHLKYIDITENPTYFSSYSTDEMDKYSIVISCGDNYVVLQPEDIFNVESSYYSGSRTIVSSKAEQEMTSAILNVSTDNKQKISLLTGYDEESSSYFVDLLEKNNYEVKTQSLLTDDIDSDSVMAIIFAPKRDLDPSAVEKINSYLDNNGQHGKNLFYIPNLDLNTAPNLDAFLDEYGISVGDGIVYESDKSYLMGVNNPFYTICDYVDSSFTENLNTSSIPVSLPYCRPLESKDAENVSTLLQFSASSCVLPSNADENWKPQDSTRNGPIPGMLLSRINYDTSQSGTNVVVCGSVIGFDYQLLSQNALNNSSYILNLVNTLNHNDNGVIIEAKTVNEQALNITAAQAITIGLILTIALPVAVAIVGIVVCLKRRRK